MSEKKVGANKSDQKKIANMVDAGYTLKQISQALFIKEEVLKRFMPEKQKKARKKLPILIKNPKKITPKLWLKNPVLKKYKVNQARGKAWQLLLKLSQSQKSVRQRQM